jgi:DNA-binding transcriptional ArsR family regulator
VARLREAGFVELVRQGRRHYARIADRPWRNSWSGMSESPSRLGVEVRGW